MTSNAAGPDALQPKSPGPLVDTHQNSHTTNGPAAQDLPPAAPPTPPSLSGKETAADTRHHINGDAAADDLNAQDESEAETVVLSEGGQDEANSRRRPIKHERSEGEAIDDAHAAYDATTHPVRTESEPSAHEQHVEEGEHGTNGNAIRGNGLRDSVEASLAPATIVRAKSAQAAEPIKALRPPSESTFTSPATTMPGRRRASSFVESRKRKDREEQRDIEPPRQRHKTDASNQSSPSSQPHKRSTSTQSGLSNGQGRKKAGPAVQDRKPWTSDSSPEASDAFSSPNAVMSAPLLLPRSKRSHRSLTSPARTVMPQHKKNVDRFGATRLARECERGDLEAVEQAYQEAPDQLNQEDFAGIAPLQKAALNGHVDVIKFLIEKNCRLDCRSLDQDTPLIDAVENGHLEVVKILLERGADPHLSNSKGQRPLDLVPSDEEDASREIRQILLKAMAEHASKDDGMISPILSREALGTVQKGSERHDLLYLESNLDNLRKYSAKGDAEAVDYFLNSIEPDNLSAVAAARGGHEIVLNLLLAAAGSRLEKDPDPAKHAETPLLAAIGRGHLGILRLLLDQDDFNPTRRNRDGKTYYEVAEERRGPKWQAERDLLKEQHEGYRLRQQQKSKKRRTASMSSGQPRPQRKASPHRYEQSSSPIMPNKRIRTAEEPPKPRRLVSARELSNQRDQKRRRRVVDEESSSPEPEVDSGSPEVQAPARIVLQDEDIKPVTDHEESSPIKPPDQDMDVDQDLTSIPANTKHETPEPTREARQAEIERLCIEEEERQRQRIEQERLAREGRLEALPVALKYAMILGPNQPLTFDGQEMGIGMKFLPIHAVELGEIDSSCETARRDEKWMMSYQAVGILGLPELDLSDHGPCSSAISPNVLQDWERREVTDKQRALFLRGHCIIEQLAQHHRFPPEGSSAYDHVAISKIVADTRERFMRMSPLYWIKYEDFVSAVPTYPHLQGLDLGQPSSCCHVVQLSEADDHSPRTFTEWILRRTSGAV